MESGIRRRQKKLPGYEAHFPVKEGKVKSELALQGAPVQRLPPERFCAGKKRSRPKEYGHRGKAEGNSKDAVAGGCQLTTLLEAGSLLKEGMSGTSPWLPQCVSHTKGSLDGVTNTGG